MTTLIDHLESPLASSREATDATTTPAQRLRSTMAACRVCYKWWGTQKTLTPEQRAVAAEAFAAEGQFLSAGKRLVDTRHSAFRAVTAIRTKATDYWKGLALPFPEPGLRLIKQERLEEFARQMTDYRVELQGAVQNLDGHYSELTRAARERLGSLFNPDDYPATLVGLFDLQVDFPSLEPPEYLVQLSPGLYAQEQQRVRARFEEAVQLAERAFTEEFARMVEHLSERLAGSHDDGTPKVFRDSAVNNLLEFFDRFKDLNVRSNAQLDALVERAQEIVRGVGAQDLRDSRSLRQRVSAGLSQVQSALDGLLVERPRRRILRQSPNPAEA